MNAIVPASSTGGNVLMPHNIDEAMRLADLMARAKMVPKHLQGDVGTCFMVVEQALRWQMSPFAVAQCTSSIGGKLMYEGKLVAAAATSCGAIVGEFDYTFDGDPAKPETLSVTATATRASDNQPRAMTLKWVDAKTDNQFWKKQPEQQLTYAAARVWCRRWSPGVILGVFAPEEFDRAGPVDTFTGTTIDATATPVEASSSEEARPEATPRRQTIHEWLEDLEAELASCDATQLEEILSRDDVQKAQDKFRNGARDRLNSLIHGALKRTAPTEDGVFHPADDPFVEHVQA